MVVVGNIFLPSPFEFRHGNEEIKTTAASSRSHEAVAAGVSAGVAGFGEDAFGCVVSLRRLQVEICIEPRPPGI